MNIVWNFSAGIEPATAAYRRREERFGRTRGVNAEERWCHGAGEERTGAQFSATGER